MPTGISEALRTRAPDAAAFPLRFGCDVYMPRAVRRALLVPPSCACTARAALPASSAGTSGAEGVLAGLPCASRVAFACLPGEFFCLLSAWTATGRHGHQVGTVRLRLRASLQ